MCRIPKEPGAGTQARLREPHPGVEAASNEEDPVPKTQVGPTSTPFCEAAWVALYDFSMNELALRSESMHR
jgi:hypothetical protein